MTTNDQLDTILGAWMDEGPMDLPDVTRRAILTAVHAAAKASAMSSLATSFPRTASFARANASSPKAAAINRRRSSRPSLLFFRCFIG